MTEKAWRGVVEFACCATVCRVTQQSAEFLIAPPARGKNIPIQADQPINQLNFPRRYLNNELYLQRLRSVRAIPIRTVRFPLNGNVLLWIL